MTDFKTNSTTNHSKQTEDKETMTKRSMDWNDILNAFNHLENANVVYSILEYLPHFQNERILLQPTNKSSIHSLIHSLPTSGCIKLYQSTSYWCISLGEQWQNKYIRIAKLSHSFIKNTEKYRDSINIGKMWALKVNTTNPKIKCVKPPSVAGFHISLGCWDKNDEQTPKCLKEGTMVSFKIKNISAFQTLRKCPQNIPGQGTNDEGLRYYPTLWVVANIEFIDFEFPTKHPPHISIACISVQLDVDKVHKFEMEQKINDKAKF